MSAQSLYQGGLTWLFGQLRTAFDQATTTATVEAPDPAHEGQWLTVASGLVCLIRPQPTRTIVVGVQVRLVRPCQIFFLADPGVSAQNRLVIDGTSYVPVGTVAKDYKSGLYVVECVE